MYDVHVRVQHEHARACVCGVCMYVWLSYRRIC